MGEGERPDISQIIIGTVDDYDSIETPMTQMLSFVPKEKYDALKKDYNELLKSLEDVEREKAIFTDSSFNFEDELKQAMITLREYETTIKTLARLMCGK